MSDIVRITARLSSPIGRAPALDALLISLAARDAGVPPPLDGEPVGVPVEPPLVQRGGLYMASLGIAEAVGHQMRWTQRPAPVATHLRLGNTAKKLALSTGPGKPTRSPMRTAIVSHVRFFAETDDGAELMRLLRTATHLGPRRAVGFGAVMGWEVEVVDAWDGAPVVDPGGAPLRPLPIDWPGVDHAAGRRALARVSPPYWQGPRRECIVPVWMEV